MNKKQIEISGLITKDRLVKDMRNLGVKEGDLLNVKASLKSIGHIEGGATTLINSLMEVVGDTGTVVTDSFVKSYPLRLLSKDKKIISDRNTPSYAGAVANAIINYPGSFRRTHPIQKFSAVGKDAEELMNNHTPESYAYDVLRVLIENGGKNLKLGTDEKVYGVGTTHVAIGKLKLKQKRRAVGINYYDKSGKLKTFQLNWAGGGHGFNNFIPKYREAGAILYEGYVGYAPSKITDMKMTFDVEIEELKKNPKIQLCSAKDCVDCRLSWEFSEYNFARFVRVNLMMLTHGKLLNAFRTCYIDRYQPAQLQK